MHLANHAAGHSRPVALVVVVPALVKTIVTCVTNVFGIWSRVGPPPAARLCARGAARSSLLVQEARAAACASAPPRRSRDASCHVSAFSANAFCGASSGDAFPAFAATPCGQWQQCWVRTRARPLANQWSMPFMPHRRTPALSSCGVALGASESRGRRSLHAACCVSSSALLCDL